MKLSEPRVMSKSSQCSKDDLKLTPYPQLENSEDVKKESEIERELTMIDEQSELIRKALSILHKKIDPILQPEIPMPAGECEKDYQPSSKLGAVLHSHIQYLRCLEKDIFELIDRVAL